MTNSLVHASSVDADNFVESLTGMCLLSFVEHAASDTLCAISLIAKVSTYTDDSDVGR